MSEAQADALVEEVILGSARGRRAGRGTVPVEVSVLRSLTLDDLPVLVNPPPITAPRSDTLKIRHSHHMLARLIAEGKELGEVSLLTGYSIAYVSDLKSNPAFAELLAYYDKQKEMIFVDVLERMKALGLSTLDELQARLESKPDEWTRRELMELTELLLGKGGSLTRGGQAQGGGAGVNISVKFVSAQGAAASGMIDVTPGTGTDGL